MKFVSVGTVPPLLSFVLLAPLIGLTACGGHAPSPVPVTAYTVSVSPQPVSIPVNGTVTFTATTTPPGGEVFWGLVDEGNGIDLGSPTSQIGGTTFTYTAPPTPPIFGGTITPAGSIAVRASVATPGSTMSQFNVVISAPSVATGFLTSNFDTVALGKTLGVWAYAVGSTNNAITMQVNGTTGGSATFGTITPLPQAPSNGEYVYTAPATMPMTGNTVTITVISQADPTKSSSMTITLTSS